MPHIKLAGFTIVAAAIAYSMLLEGDYYVTATLVLIGFMAMLFPMKHYEAEEAKNQPNR